MKKMDEKDFTRSLREFHGPEKYTELLRITLFGKKVDLFKFYESAKKRGGSTEAVIMTRWRDICIEIGALHSADNLSLEEAHKASQYFCDCFHNFVYPNPNPPNITRYGRRTKPKSFPNDYDITYKNVDNYRSLKGTISDANLLWMANNVTIRPKYKFFTKREVIKKSNRSILENQWIIPSHDKSVPIPYTIQSKVACAAKSATESLKLSKEEQLYRSLEEEELEDKFYKIKRKTKVNGEKNTKKTVMTNIIHEVSKFLISGHDLEVCLSIILKSLLVTSMPHIPGLCKYLWQINLELSRKMKVKTDLKTHKELMRILDLLVNILILIVRDLFPRFTKKSENIGSILEQITMCMDSLKDITCLILIKVKEVFKEGYFVKNSFKINIRDIEEGKNGKLSRQRVGFRVQNGEKGIIKNNHQMLELKNGNRGDEIQIHEEDESDEIDYVDILLNIFLLMKFLAKTSKEMCQFNLICRVMDPLLKNLSYSITDFKAPKYWLWEEFQECLQALFSACHQVCKKISGKMQIATVGNLYLLLAVLIQEEKVSKKFFRKIVQILLTFHSYFDFEKLNFMKYSIRKACQILVQTMINYPVKTGINGQNEKKRYQIQPGPREDREDNSYTLYSKQAMNYLDRTFKRRTRVKDNLDSEFVNPDNPMCNPWSSLPWDYTSLNSNNSQKKKGESKEESLKRKKRKLINEGEQEDNNKEREKGLIKLSKRGRQGTHPNNKDESQNSESSQCRRDSPLKMFFNDTVDANVKLTLEESVEYLQKFYKVVFGITENEPEENVKQNKENKKVTSLVVNRQIRNHTVVRNGVEKNSNKNTKMLKNKKNSNHYYHHNHNHNHNDDYDYDEEDEADYSEDLKIEGSMKGRPAIDYEFLHISKYSKSTKELVSLCLVEMAKYDYCLEVINKNYNQILDSAFDDHCSRPLWTLIHQLQVTRTYTAFQ